MRRPIRWIGAAFGVLLHPKPTQYNTAHFAAYAPLAAASILAPLLVLAVTLRQRAQLKTA